MEGSCLGLLIPLVARLINKKVTTILVGDVARIPEQLRVYCTDGGASFRSFRGEELPLRLRTRMNLHRKIYYSINDPLGKFYTIGEHRARELMWRRNHFMGLEPRAPLWDVEEAE